MEYKICKFAKLKTAPFKHCFLSIPSDWAQELNKKVTAILKLDGENKSIVVSWAGHTHFDTSEEVTVKLNYLFLKYNGLTNSEMVLVTSLHLINACSRVKFLVTDDVQWQDIHLNLEIAEKILLSQFYVIKKNQAQILFLDGGAVVCLKAIEISSDVEVAVLTNNTVVEILPPHQNIKDAIVSKPTGKIVGQTLNYSMRNADKNISSFNSCLINVYKYVWQLVKCSKSFEVNLLLKFNSFNFSSSTNNNLSFLIKYHPSIILISNDCLKNTKYSEVKFFISKITTFTYDDDKSKLLKNDTDEIFATVVNLEKFPSFKNTLDYKSEDIDTFLKCKSCIISLPLQNLLKIKENQLIFLKFVEIIFDKQPVLNVCVNSKNDFDSCDVSKIVCGITELASKCPVVINNNCVLPLQCGSVVLIETHDRKCNFLNASSLLKLEITKKLKSFHYSRLKNDEVTIPRFNKPAIIDVDIFNEIVESLKKNFTRNQNLSNFILLLGSKGSGKSSLIVNLFNHLPSLSLNIYVEKIYLKKLKGKTVETIKKMLIQSIHKCVNFSPSILAIEDLDTFYLESYDDGILSFYSKYMAVVLGEILLTLFYYLRRSHSKVIVIGTGCSKSCINSEIIIPRGRNIFSKQFKISNLDGSKRINIFKTLLRRLYENECDKKFDNNVLKIDDKELNVKLDGLHLCDIEKIVKRTFLESRRRWTKNWAKNSIISDDLSKGFNGFISLANKALKNETKPNAIGKIGGMKEAKNCLEEMIILPSKYPQIFSNSGLSLRMGVLLYGPPGCGKTALVQSLVQSANVNFIYVKGPEILSKYIGQSEKSIRDIFQRAENARPCVIFFDEFESIGPRRGHDKTGVTDRVVNQLLTQMDGVEGRTQVYVVAATSRPDLIDPALLRPGRLDKCVLCPIPNAEERLEILSCLIENQANVDPMVKSDHKFSDSIDWSLIAKITNGFSGADLQSLLSNAQLIAAKESIGFDLYQDISSLSDRMDPAPDFCKDISNLSENISLESDFNENISNVPINVDSDFNENIPNVPINVDSDFNENIPTVPINVESDFNENIPNVPINVDSDFNENIPNVPINVDYDESSLTNKQVLTLDELDCNLENDNRNSEYLNTPKTDNLNHLPDFSNLVVTFSHLKKALKDVKASISNSEKNWYENLYQRGARKKVDRNAPRNRETLA